MREAWGIIEAFLPLIAVVACLALLSKLMDWLD